MSVLDRGNPQDELQERNGQEHERVFDPESYILLGEIFQELKKMNLQLQLITDEDVSNDY